MATFRILDIFNLMGRGIVITGTVMSGEISKGMWTDINGVKAEVSSIESFNRSMETAKEGEHCGLLLKGVEKKDVQKGQIVSFE